MSRTTEPVAIALDLGTTRFKLAALDAGGRLEIVDERPAPSLHGNDLVREGDPDEFLAAATALVDAAATRWPERALGLVSQRSTFTIWDRRSGKALIPMVSWQDRRAAGWCAAHLGINATVTARTGLLLSPHYLGPKLAVVLDEHPEIRRACAVERAVIGTLDTWLSWHWCASRPHQTDLTMAARTALVDLESSGWSTELCDLFAVPETALAEIRPTDQQSLVLDNGLHLNTVIADQGAGAVAVLAPDDDAALVNFGTGAFVLYPRVPAATRRPGYLTGPVLDTVGASTRFAIEGTINGAGPALDRFHPGPTELPLVDDCPDGFAIPDLAGVGSPHWRSDVGLVLSPDAERAAPLVKRRIVLEGLLFRVFEILTDLGGGEPPKRVLISGGAVRDAAIGLGLAQLLQKPVSQLREPESTLLGTARLAAGLSPYANPATVAIKPASGGPYLRAKYARWREWAHRVLAE